MFSVVLKNGTTVYYLIEGAQKSGTNLLFVRLVYILEAVDNYVKAIFPNHFIYWDMPKFFVALLSTTVQNIPFSAFSGNILGIISV